MSPLSAGGAAVLAGMAVLLLLPSRSLPSEGWVTGRLLRWWPVGLVLVGPLVGSSLGLRETLLGLLTAGAVAGVVRMGRRGRANRIAERRTRQVLAACEAIASELTAGQPPGRALERAAEEWSELAPVAAAGQMASDVPAALRLVSMSPGAGQLRRVAATWQVAHDTGTGLATALHGAADAIRAETRTSRLVAAELAAADATARMLAVLPVGVLLLGMGIGGDPIGFLLGSTPGVLVLGAGIGLSFAGLSWLDRIADGVLRR